VDITIFTLFFSGHRFMNYFMKEIGYYFG